MIIDLVVSSSENGFKYHKFGKKCVGRFFNIDTNLMAVDLKTLSFKKQSSFGNQEIYLENFKIKHFRQQDILITSFCQKCCKDIVNVLLKNAKPEAVTLAKEYFKNQKTIKFLKT